MPDANGNFKGAFFTATSWIRVFGQDPWDPAPVEIDPPELNITWDPDPSLDGAHFTPE